MLLVKSFFFVFINLRPLLHTLLEWITNFPRFRQFGRLFNKPIINTRLHESARTSATVLTVICKYRIMGYQRRFIHYKSVTLLKILFLFCTYNPRHRRLQADFYRLAPKQHFSSLILRSTPLFYCRSVCKCLNCVF